MCLSFTGIVLICMPTSHVGSMLQKNLRQDPAKTAPKCIQSTPCTLKVHFNHLMLFSSLVQQYTGAQHIISFLVVVECLSCGYVTCAKIGKEPSLTIRYVLTFSWLLSDGGQAGCEGHLSGYYVVSEQHVLALTP